MSVLLITYDLQKPGQDYTDLLAKIRSFNWAMLSESSYAIQTDLTPEAVYALLRPFMDANDQLYAIALKRPYMGFGPTAVNDWLENNLQI